MNVGEGKDDEALAKKYAALCDIFVMDAFGTAHRAQASTHGAIRFAQVACGGPLLMAELDALAKALENPARPLVAIVAGSKVSTKLELLGNLVGKVDQLIVGGGIANTFIAAMGFPVGKSLCEADLLDTARDIMADAKSRGADIPIPTDVVVAPGSTPMRRRRQEGRRGRRRRHDPRHRPRHGGALRGDDRQGRQRDLERPGRRVRVRRFRQGHRVAGPCHRRLGGVLDRRRRRHAGRRGQIRRRFGHQLHLHRRRRFLEFCEGKELPAVAALGHAAERSPSRAAMQPVIGL